MSATMKRIWLFARLIWRPHPIAGRVSAGTAWKVSGILEARDE